MNKMDPDKSCMILKDQQNMLKWVLLRCLNDNVWNFWTTTDGKNIYVQEYDNVTTTVIQLQYQTEPIVAITEKELLTDDGDFSIKKLIEVSKSARQTRTNVNNRLKIVIFTNRKINRCKYIEKCDKLSFLGRIIDCAYKINLKLFNEFCFNNIFLLTIDALDISSMIIKEIEHLQRHYGVKDTTTDVPSINSKYSEFIESSSGLTKHNLLSIFLNILLDKYTIDLSQQNYEFYSMCPLKSIWNDIIHDKLITVVDFDVAVFEFLKQYIGSEINKYCPDYFGTGTFSGSFVDNNLFCKNNQNLRIYFGNFKNISLLDVYKNLWMCNKVPLLLVCNNANDYRTIIALYNNFKSDLKIIILSKNDESSVLGCTEIEKLFQTLHDLEKDTDKILDLYVNFQGRFKIKLLDILDESKYDLITTKDIIYILLNDYVVGNKVETLPSYFIERKLHRIFLKVEVLSKLPQEHFIIENKTNSNILLKTIDSLNNVTIVEEGQSSLLLPTFDGVTHILSFEGENRFEWKDSFGCIKNIREYVIEQTQHCKNYSSLFNLNMHIISANTGMGKSTFLDFVILHAPMDMWTLKVNLGNHIDHYRSTRKLSVCDHLRYFNNEALKKSNCVNFDLARSIFEKFLIEKKVLIVLDGFDEIIAYKKEAMDIIRSFRKENYPLWISTRPHIKSYIEEQLDAIATSPKPLSVEEQHNFLIKYFEASSSKNYSIVEKFVKMLLDVAKQTLNYADYKFGELPLQLKLLADVFGDELERVLVTNVVSVSDKFDLLYFYEEYIKKKIEILCKKYIAFASNVRLYCEHYHVLLALELLFDEHDLTRLKIQRKLNDYFESHIECMSFLQKEGIVLLENGKIVGNFEHRTFAEYLAARWLVANLNSDDEPTRKTVEILNRRRFYHMFTYKNLFRVFDYILAVDCPLHNLIIMGKYYQAELLIKSNPDDASILDKGGRTVVHLAALYGTHHAKIPDHGMIDIDDKMVSLIKQFPDEKLLNVEDTFIGYTALDYSIGYGTLAIANVLCEKINDLDINIYVRPSHLQVYFQYCIRLNSYAPLYRLLLKYTLCNKMVTGKITKNATVDSFNDSLEFDEMTTESVSEYVKEFNVISVPQLLEILNMKSSKIYRNLQLASAFGSQENVIDLLASEGRINYPCPLLHCAVIHERLEIIELLLCCGANIDIVDVHGNTALHLACENCFNVEVAKKLLLRGANVNVQNCEGDAPLHHALKHNCINIAKLLLPDKSYQMYLSAETGGSGIEFIKKFNVNAQNADGDTPLLLALKHDCMEVVAQLLLSYHADVNIVNKRGYSCLHYAAKSGNNQIVLELIYDCLDVNKQNEDGDTPLLLSFKEKRFTTAKLLLSKGGSNVTKVDQNGDSCLHFAAGAGKDHLIIDLLDKGADIDKQNSNGETPLILAIKSRNISTVTLLLSKGANPNLMDNTGKDCLHHAAESRTRNIVLALINEGVYLNGQNNSGETPLIIAVKCQHISTVNLLLSNNADVNVVDRSGSTCVHHAVQTSGDEMIRELIDKDFDINKQNNEGNTPLLLAIQNRLEPTVKLLMEKGAADIHVENNNGYTCLHYAAGERLLSCIEDLVRKGADINKRTNDGNTPLSLHLSNYYDSNSTIMLLLTNSSNVNAVDSYYGNTALHVATLEGNNDNVRAIIAMGADVNKQNNDGVTPLYSAISRENTDTMKILLENGADVNIENRNGSTCLHYAIDTKKDEVIIVEIIKHGADILKQNNNGDTPLMLAKKKKLPNIVKLLSSHGAKIEEDKRYDLLYDSIQENEKGVVLELLNEGLDINKPDERGNTPLLCALNQDRMDLIELLLSRGADVQLRNNEGMSCLHYAARLGSFDLVERFIKGGCDINACDSYDCTPLFTAFTYNKLNIAKLLLAREADVNITSNNHYEFSCMHRAIEDNNEEMVEELLKKGYDLEKHNNYGITPLLCAIKYNNSYIAKLLLSKGANINVENENGSTCLHLAAEENMVEVASMLISKGANINKKNNNLDTPLLVALRYDREEVSKLLLSKGAIVDVKNFWGDYALHYAATSGFDDIVRIILDKGFDIDKQNTVGDTALNCAISSNKIRTARFLLSKGADINCVNSDDNTSLHLAAAAGYEDIVLDFIDKGLDINKPNDDGYTPLSLALTDNRVSTTELLFSKISIVSMEDKRGYTYLHYASKLGNDRIVEDLLDKGFDVNKQNDNDETPLLVALEYNNVSTAKLLLSRGARIDVAENVNGFNCLHYLAKGNESELLLELIDGGADIDKMDNNNHTPLIVAINAGHIDVTLLLLSKGAAIDGVDKYGNTCLHQAASRGSKTIMSALIGKAKEIVNKKNSSGSTALFVALDEDSVDVAKILIANGADVNARNYNGYTCVHHAVKKGLEDVLLDMINNGVDVEQLDDAGCSPLIFAFKKEHDSIAKLLISKGANIYVETKHGWTCLHYAAKMGADDIIVDLLDKGANVDKINGAGNSALLLALENNRESSANLLLSRGANFEAESTADLNSCLHYAAKFGMDDILLDLINKGLDVNKQNNLGNTPLLLALCNDNGNAAKLLISNGALLDIPNKNGCTVLHGAIRVNEKSIINEYIEKGHDIDKRNGDDESPLLLALENNNRDVVSLLISKGADLSFKGSYGSYLHHAVDKKQIDIVVDLLEKGLDVNYQIYNGMTPVLVALQNNRTDIAELLISKGADVNIVDNDSMSCLHHALTEDSIEIVKTLIEHGVDINRQNNYGQTALLCSLRNKLLNLTELLISNGADINTINNKGASCLYYASKSGYNDIVIELLRRGLNVNRKNRKGNTPLLAALKKKHISTVMLLISKGANVHYIYNNGFNCLHHAVKTDDADLVLEFINRGLDVNFQNDYGSTPLLLALQEQSTDDIVKLLLSKGAADVKIRNDSGDTCLHFAAKAGRDDIVKELLTKGADINKKNDEGHTPLFEAANNEKKTTVEFLLSRGATTPIENDKSVTCLYSCIIAGYDDLVLKFIEMGININSRKSKSNNALLLALQERKSSIAQMLLDKGADINVVNDKGYSCLHIASREGLDELVLDFINKGLDINKQTDDNHTPISLAILRGHTSTSKLLFSKLIGKASLENIACLHYATETGANDIIMEYLNAGFDINTRNDNGNTPLLIALSNGKIDTVKLLLSKGADINLKNYDGYSCIHCAAISECDDILLELLNKGLDENNQTQDGNTPLLLALMYRKLSTAKLLLSRDVKVHIKNKSGRSSLHYAAQIGDDEVVSVLIKKGANVDEEDDVRWTPLHFAIRYNHESTVDLLLDSGASNYGNGLIHTAARYGNLSILNKLIKDDSNVNEKNSSNTTPLHCAINFQTFYNDVDVQKQMDVIKFLLDKGANISIEDGDGNTLLNYCDNYPKNASDKSKESTERFYNKVKEMLLLRSS